MISIKASTKTILLSIAIIITAFPQADNSLIIGNNFRVYPSDVNQTEVFIVKSPLDEDVLFASANTLTFIPFFVSEGIYVSTNGGESWRGNDTCTGEPITFHYGDPGIAIDINGTFVLTRKGTAGFPGLYSHRSTDMGVSWSFQKNISTDDLERATLTTDVTPGSPYFGRTYAIWVKFSNPFSVWSTFTDDGGLNWNTPMQVNNPVQRSAGGDITMGLNGKVYICWAGLTNVSPFRETIIGFAKSEDGGANWTVTENALTVNGITGLLTEKGNIRVNGLPSIAIDTTGGPRNGWIYIVTGQKNLAPAGTDPDIILYRSTDDGVTWSSGIRVNQDPLNNGKIQFFPAVHVDKFGAVDIIFYDDRNTTSDSSGVFLARSIDGGDSWVEFEISDHNFKPVPIGGLGQGYMGDNIDLTSTGTKIIPVWMDNSTGIYQIWTAPVEYSAVNVEEDNSDNIPTSFQLKQNYPNPFNPSTVIEYSLNRRSFVVMKVYDIKGTELKTLVSEEQTPGNYRVDFDGTKLPSGIYFYRVSANGITKTKPMVLIK